MGDIFYSRRSIRRFKDIPVDPDLLKGIIDRARFYPSASNLQPVRFMVTVSREKILSALPYMRWAGYIRPKRDPVPGKEPKALIVVCHDRKISDSRYVPYDVGAAVQSLLLAGVQEGLGGCWIGAIDKAGIREVFEVPSDWEVHCVVALGYPDENPIVEECHRGNIRYFLDEKDVLHVPKRSLEEVMRWVQ